MTPFRSTSQSFTQRANLAADTTALEREIDARVYRLYGLTRDEIRIVEEGTK